MVTRTYYNDFIYRFVKTAYTGDAKDDDVKRKNVNKVEDKMSTAAVDELEQDKLKSESRHSCSGMRSDNFEVPFEAASVSTRFRQCHRREDSGFFDTTEQQDLSSASSSESSLKLSDKVAGTFSSNSLLEPDNNRSSFGSNSAFALKESSDEESDSLPFSVGFGLSSDEQSGQELNVDETVEENKISSTRHSPSFSSCRGTSEALDHLHHTVSSPQFSSDGYGSTPVLLPPPDSSSPLMSNYAKLCHFDQSPMENSKDIKNASDPYVSPPLASDDLLRKLCPVYVMVSLGFFVTGMGQLIKIAN